MAKSPDGMIKSFGNKANTQETSLPMYGAAAARKGKAKPKMGKSYHGKD